MHAEKRVVVYYSRPVRVLKFSGIGANRARISYVIIIVIIVYDVYVTYIHIWREFEESVETWAL